MIRGDGGLKFPAGLKLATVAHKGGFGFAESREDGLFVRGGGGIRAGFGSFD